MLLIITPVNTQQTRLMLSTMLGLSFILGPIVCPLASLYYCGYKFALLPSEVDLIRFENGQKIFLLTAPNTWPWGVIALGLVAWAVLMVVASRLVMRYGRPGVVRSRSGIYGTGRYPSPAEIKAVWQKEENITDPGSIVLTGTIITEELGVPGTVELKGALRVPAEINKRHWLILGKSGSGKTSKLMRPIMQRWLNAPCGLIIADPKQELSAEIVAQCHVLGRKYYYWNPSRPERTVGWNILQGLDETRYMDAMRIAQSLVRDNPRFPAFSNGARGLLAACIMRYQTLPQIFSALNNAHGGLKGKTDETLFIISHSEEEIYQEARRTEKLRTLIYDDAGNYTTQWKAIKTSILWRVTHDETGEAFPPAHVIRNNAALFIQNVAAERSTLIDPILSTTLDAFLPISGPDCWDVLEVPEFDPLTLIYKNPTTRERFGPGELPPVLILGINPENQDVLGPFLGACIRRLMFILREEAQRCGGRLPHDFYLLLDEFAILMGHRGGWKDFEKDINDLRSQGVGIFAAHQVKDQLYSLWEKDIAEIIEDSFNTVVALAGCDDDTARWVEEMAGKSTVYKVNEMLSTSQNTVTNNFGMSSAYSESEAPLVPASTVQNPPRGAQATFLLPVEKPPRVPPGYNTLRRHVFHMRLDEVYADRGIARIAPELLLRRAQGLHGSLEEVAAGWGIPLTSRLAKGSAR